MRTSLPAPPPGGVVPPGYLCGVSDASRSLLPVHSALAAWTLVVVAWLVVCCGALLLLRAVCLESLDPEQDDSDEQVSGHAPS